tara:strand:- start:551 stop:823 length:273 start_codon:yes stop_codon:yes gene_type:complete
VDTKDAIKMSKANSNFDHLVKDEFGDKKVRGTYYTINKLEERVEKLENIIKEFMDTWGPDVQRQRDERDERWDEMVRVLTIQKKHKRDGV